MVHCAQCVVHSKKYSHANEALQKCLEEQFLLEQKLRSEAAEARKWLSPTECQQLNKLISLLLRVPEETNKPHPYQAPHETSPDIIVKALEGPAIPPAFNRVSCLQLSRCSKCKSRNPNKVSALRKRTELSKNVNVALHGLIRRLSFQLNSPGGGQALHHCIQDLTEVDVVDLEIFNLKPWNQAVSARFLRRLCKLYTSFDLIVDHQIPVLHYRHNVNRSPFQGELYIGDRFREFPEGTGLPPPKYATGADWLNHLILPACKAGGQSQSFVSTLHSEPANIHWSPQNTLNPVRPGMQDMSVDEHGSFAVYGPATYVVVFDKSQHHFYEVCEAIWAHWMQLQCERPDMDANNVFYWIDMFAMSPLEAHKPLGEYLEAGKIEQVVKNAAEGVLIFSDSLTAPSWTTDLWAQWFAWEAGRWLKSCSFIRPLQQERFLFHERRCLGKAIEGSTTHLKVPATSMSALAKIYGAAYIAGDKDTEQEEDELQMCGRAEYRAFQHLLNGLAQTLPPLAETSAQNSADMTAATATLQRLQQNSGKLAAALAEVAKEDAVQLLLGKALRECQIAALKTQLSQAETTFSAKAARAILFLVLASDQVMPDDMIKIAGNIVISDVVHQDTRCSAGMNVLHYIALQPVLLLNKDQNTMRKLMELMIKTGPNVNAQDFWGQTPLHVLSIHTAMAYTMESAPASLVNRLANVMAFLLSKGADPSIENIAGDSAAVVGNSFTQMALHLAQSAAAGEISLDPGIVEDDTAQPPAVSDNEQPQQEPQQEESQQAVHGTDEILEETEGLAGELQENAEPSLHEDVHQEVHEENAEGAPAEGCAADAPGSDAEGQGSREATPDIQADIGDLPEHQSEADPSVQEPVAVEGPVGDAAADVSAVDAEADAEGTPVVVPVDGSGDEVVAEAE